MKLVVIISDTTNNFIPNCMKENEDTYVVEVKNNNELIYDWVTPTLKLVKDGKLIVDTILIVGNNKDEIIIGNAIILRALYPNVDIEVVINKTENNIGDRINLLREFNIDVF